VNVIVNQIQNNFKLNTNFYNTICLIIVGFLCCFFHILYAESQLLGFNKNSCQLQLLKNCLYIIYASADYGLYNHN